jgi:hypothetical protein
VPATQFLQSGTGFCKKSMTGGWETSMRAELWWCRLQAPDETDPAHICVAAFFLRPGFLNLDLVGDDITISCSTTWILRLIFDKRSINHNAANNTGVLVRRAKI